VKLGLDGFPLPDRRLTPVETLAFVREHGLDGAFFPTISHISPTLDMGELRELLARAGEHGLYVETGVGFVNPARFPSTEPVLALGDGDYRRGLERQIRVARELGWTELRSGFGNETDRVNSSIPWSRQLEDTREFLRSLAPMLRDLGCRLNLETHADVTSYEVVPLIEAVGPDVVGICLDTGNLLCRAEDPIAAIRRLAPYVHQTHAKDCILVFGERGLVRQMRPCGEGLFDWDLVLSILGAHAPELNLSIEDHKGLFPLDIYDADWHALHPDLTAADLAELVRIARAGEARIARGEIAPVEEYEAIPWEAHHIARLRQSVAHLRAAVVRAGLAG
jgi:sugar phosphate isomerase/epimerase